MSSLKIQKIERCTAVASLPAFAKGFESRMRQGGLWSYRSPTTMEVAEFAVRKMDEARQQDEATHARNAEALSINSEIRGSIEALMDSVGMPKRFSQKDPNSRARYPKTLTLDAGYISDLRREVPVDDGFTRSTQLAETLRLDCERLLAEGIKEEEQGKASEERSAAAEKERRLANVDLAEIILRYGLDREADWPDVLEALRAKDQRLDLAVAMQETRGDWSDGFYRVEGAIGRFKIETDEDKDIAACICGLLGCDDGRVFRDTKWNYGKLFASAVDQQLARDVQIAASRV